MDLIALVALYLAFGAALNLWLSQRLNLGFTHPGMTVRQHLVQTATIAALIVAWPVLLSTIFDEEWHR